MSIIKGDKSRSSAIALIAAAGATCLLTPTLSGSAAAHGTAHANEFASETVDVADLDLRHSSGQHQLRMRIQSAAARVCRFDGFLDTACADVATVDGLHQAYLFGRVDAAVGGAASAAVIVRSNRN